MVLALLHAGCHPLRADVGEDTAEWRGVATVIPPAPSATSGYFLGVIASLEFLQRSVQLGRPVPSGRIGGGQLFPGRGLCHLTASGGPPRRRKRGRGGCWHSGWQRIGAHRIGRRRGNSLETVDRVVDLDGDSGPMLGIVGFVWERMSSLCELGCGEGGTTEWSQSTSRPWRRVRAIKRPTRSRQQSDDDCQENPAPRLGARRGLGRGRRGRRGGLGCGRRRARPCRRGGRKGRRGRRCGRRRNRRRGRRRHRGRGDRCASSWSCPGRRRFRTGRRARPAWRRSRGADAAVRRRDLRMHRASLRSRAGSGRGDPGSYRPAVSCGRRQHGIG